MIEQFINQFSLDNKQRLSALTVAFTILLLVSVPIFIFLIYLLSEVLKISSYRTVLLIIGSQLAVAFFINILMVRSRVRILELPYTRLVVAPLAGVLMVSLLIYGLISESNTFDLMTLLLLIYGWLTVAAIGSLVVLIGIITILRLSSYSFINYSLLMSIVLGVYYFFNKTQSIDAPDYQYFINSIFIALSLGIIISAFIEISLQQRARQITDNQDNFKNKPL